MTNKKDTRTREEKLRDLAANSGATEAEKNAALFFLRNSAIDYNSKKDGSGSTITAEPPPTPSDELKRRKAAGQCSQYETARRVQRRINEEIRRRNAPPTTPSKAAQRPLSTTGQPDYLPLFLLASFIILSLYYGC